MKSSSKKRMTRSPKIKAVILAAGEGSRMRPLTYTRPKVMLPVVNKPILEHLLMELINSDIKNYIFVVGYHEEKIRDHFLNGDKWGVNIEYVSQSQSHGTADALRTVERLVDSVFLVVNGDILTSARNIRKIIKKHGNTISIIEKTDVQGLGVVETGKGKVVRIYEKAEEPPTNLANAGMYLFTPEIFDAISKTRKSVRGEFDLTDSIQLMIDCGIPVYSQVIDQWIDFSFPWDLLSANEKLMPNIRPEITGTVEESAIVKDPVVIGKGTIIRSGSYIVGPVIIGEDCDIGPNCFIRPSTTIGDKCHIGAAVEVKNSIIMKGSKVPHLSYVGDSIIGEDCNLGAGTKIANLKLDILNMKIMVNSVETGRRKFGAILGDCVETGINTSINMGTFIGNGVRIMPGALVHGNIPPGKIYLTGENRTNYHC